MAQINVDARGSLFTEIGRDQVVIVKFTNCTFNDSPPLQLPSETYSHTSNTVPSPRSPPFVLPDGNHPASSASTSTQSRRILAHSFEIGPGIDIVESLIVNIVQSLMQPDCPGYYCELKRELKSLREMLTLARVAISMCESRPLRQSLARFTSRQVDGCNPILQELLGKIKSHRRDLGSTPIGFLWSTVLASGDEMGLESLRKKLSVYQNFLGQCLMAL